MFDTMLRQERTYACDVVWHKHERRTLLLALAEVWGLVSA